MRLILHIITFSSLTLLSLQCSDKCKGLTERIDRTFTQQYKDSIFHFANGTQWVFKSNTGDDDTSVLSTGRFIMEEGGCITTRDCCGRYYNEKGYQSILFLGNDNLKKYNLIQLGGKEISLRQTVDPTFSHIFFKNPDTYFLSLDINGTTLTDVLTYEQFFNYDTPNKAYWSISKGLVRYEYLLQNNSRIIYERKDL